MESPIPVVETRLFALRPLDPPSSRRWSDSRPQAASAS